MAYREEDSKCRTCLSEFRNMISITADYLVFDELITMTEIIVACTSVQITPNDNFSQYMCDVCVEDAIKAYSFRKQCERTDEILKSQPLNIKQDAKCKSGFHCETCSQDFTTIEELSEHVSQHEFAYECVECLLKFPMQLKLDEHRSSHHERTSTKVHHSCNLCGKRFLSEATLENHITKNHTANTLRSMRRKSSAKETEKTNEIENASPGSSWCSDNENPESDTKSEADSETKIEDVQNLSEQILRNATEKNENGLYQCITCPEYFESLPELRKHMRKHKSFKCKVCNKFFTIISNLRRHLRAHSLASGGTVKVHGDGDNSTRSYKCISCEKIFTKRKLLSEHLKKHKGFACPFCTSVFTFATNLRKHIRCHNNTVKEAARVWKQQQQQQPPVEKRTCDICSKVFKYRPSMLKHRKKHDVSGKDCSFCNEVFENSTKLYKHMEEVHAHEKKVSCQLCDKRFFKEWNLKTHMAVHTGVKPYMCEICGMSFALGGNLAAHKRLHTGVKPYKCSTCGKCFAQHSALRSHEAGHSNRRDYVCPDCGKAFSRVGAMKNHRKRHQANKPYACSMCSLRFVFNTDRKRHMIVHTGERKHTCNVCNKSFNRLTNLTVHKRIHTGEYRFRCTLCDKGFVQAHAMRSHVKVHEKFNKKWGLTDGVKPEVLKAILGENKSFSTT